MAASLTNSSLSFGENYAILNLDWMTGLVNAVKNTSEGQTLIENCVKWNDAIHQTFPRPLTVFSTLSFSPGQPEVKPNSPFAKLIAPYGDLSRASPEVQIDDHFKLDEKDIVVEKTRWCASIGNALEQILQARNINTVIISGLSLSGVVMSTVYRLFDLDYMIYVIRDNVLELPVNQTAEFAHVVLDMLLPKMGLKVISLGEALQALGNS
ncbi:hypothetical protein DTO021D3_5125 [Paecilomyces variotii]|nr:hypothetical protein DTO032I3_8587 [Paecilomyces variotii]KAJ9277993.1 hypothetical protein DTO021D3_5125 [Paecilomyces variotii]KAJ9338591.1 hypothetical protein DTO027B6_8876 [Paecilomyces variotii]KAJ9389380.1 hypothetical protein DTO032I4_2405 [Paecilomyces variotii]